MADKAQGSLKKVSRLRKFHRITVLDLLLPSILTGEAIGREKLALLSHGGFCRNCKQCRYSICSFGKA
ncbi:hypothetical protein [uncultured Desulfobulbus sp.]|uniref:hypothetical protein n=1 Tax=uncultured Desulfobulbus sp. TaxID=239745 RepID=UPI0029C7EE4A|nr:hypothetical protein [uncultured Desulfobulbus sp.]